MLHKSTHHGRAESLAELLRMGEKLIDTPDSGIPLVLPPTVSRAHRDVRLDIPTRDSVEEYDIRARRRAFIHERSKFPLHFLEGRCRAPPLGHMGPRKPLMQETQLGPLQRSKGNRRGRGAHP